MVHIKFQKVSVSYGRYTIFRNFSLNINQGEIVSLFGPSGCGKTSLMKVLLGLVTPAKGGISIYEEDSSSYSKIIAYVPQDNQLLPWLTVEQNVDLWRKESGNTEKSVTENVLKVVGLYKHKSKMVSDLSGGMKRRTSLARALVTKADILCLDEVLVSIERGLRHQLMCKMREYVKTHNISTMIISHDYEEVVFMSDKIYVLSPSPTEIVKKIEIKENKRKITFFDSEIFKIKSTQLVE